MIQGFLIINIKNDTNNGKYGIFILEDRSSEKGVFV